MCGVTRMLRHVSSTLAFHDNSPHIEYWIQTRLWDLMDQPATFRKHVIWNPFSRMLFFFCSITHSLVFFIGFQRVGKMKNIYVFFQNTLLETLKPFYGHHAKMWTSMKIDKGWKKWQHEQMCPPSSILVFFGSWFPVPRVRRLGCFRQMTRFLTFAIQVLGKVVIANLVFFLGPTLLCRGMHLSENRIPHSIQWANHHFLY